MKTEYGVIYLMCNTINRKCYVGQTKHFDRRIDEHFSRQGHSPHLDNAILKYGRQAFAIHVLEVCPVDDLKVREIFWIATLDTYSHGYNLTRGGEGTNGFNYVESKGKKRKGQPLTPEHREKIRKSILKWREDNPDKAIPKKPKPPRKKRKPVTEETRRRMSVAQKKRFQREIDAISRKQKRD